MNSRRNVGDDRAGHDLPTSCQHSVCWANGLCSTGLQFAKPWKAEGHILFSQPRMGSGRLRSDSAIHVMRNSLSGQPVVSRLIKIASEGKLKAGSTWLFSTSAPASGFFPILTLRTSMRCTHLARPRRSYPCRIRLAIVPLADDPFSLGSV